MDNLNTHNVIVDFGKHKGIPWTRLPVSYLTWMINANHSQIDFARAEIARRGTTLPDLEISGHAIDRASLSCRRTWHETKNENEGLNSWLIRISQEALAAGIIDKKGRYVWNNLICLAIENDGIWPVVKTVMPVKLKNILSNKDVKNANPNEICGSINYN